MLWEHEQASKHLHSFLKSSQMLLSISISRQKHREHVFHFYQKVLQQKKGTTFCVKSLCSRHHYVSSSCQVCNCIKIISACIFFGLFSNCPQWLFHSRQKEYLYPPKSTCEYSKLCNSMYSTHYVYLPSGGLSVVDPSLHLNPLLQGRQCIQPMLEKYPGGHG